MKIAVISGSHRPCETHRISLFVKEELEKKGIEVFHYSLMDNPLPLWSEDAWDDDSDLVKNILNDLQEKISSCDAYVIMSPEWGGMVAPGLKNFMLMSGSFRFKPAYLIIVSVTTICKFNYIILKKTHSFFNSSNARLITIIKFNNI